jgi:hypothetical protein
MSVRKGLARRPKQGAIVIAKIRRMDIVLVGYKRMIFEKVLK